MQKQVVKSNSTTVTAAAVAVKTATSSQTNKLDQWIMIAALGFVFCLGIACIFVELFSLTTLTQTELAESDRPITTAPAPAAAAKIDPVHKKIALASRGEQETCSALFRLFGKTFIKVRPPFLVNPETGRRLELDCFNQELMLGVEYNGIQHYVYPNPFHRTQLEFEAQLRRDECKANQCKAAGVLLITVPFTVKRSDIESYLRQAFERSNFASFLTK
jgi:hypothetical protein